MNKELGDILKL